MLRTTLALGVVLLTSVPAAAQPKNPFVAELERTLDMWSFGPNIGVGTRVTQSGVGAMLTLGASAAVFDREAITDPACEARQAEERKALGGEAVGPWGELIEGAQQECRVIEEHWYVDHEFGAEVGLVLSPARGVELRTWTAPWSWRYVSLGASVSGAFGDDPGGGTAFGARIGPELSAHLRFGSPGWRPLASAFLRLEVTALRRDVFGDQLVGGARFLFDL